MSENLSSAAVVIGALRVNRICMFVLVGTFCMIFLNMYVTSTKHTHEMFK